MTVAMRIIGGGGESLDYRLSVINAARKIRSETLIASAETPGDDRTGSEVTLYIDFYEAPNRRDAQTSLKKLFSSSFAQTKGALLQRAKAALTNSAAPRDANSAWTMSKTFAYPENIWVSIYLPNYKMSHFASAVVLATAELLKYAGRKAAFLSRASLRGIYVGDIVASSSMRHSGGDGRFVWRKPLFFELIRCALILSHDRNLIADYCHTPEPTYTQALIARICEANGAQCFEIGARGEVRFSTAGLVGRHRLRARVEPVDAELDFDSLVTLAEDFSEKRLNELLFHRYIVEPRKAEWPPFVQQSLAPERVGSVNALVFLHDFGDGQYIGGLDGFVDLVDWAVFTLESLLEFGTAVTVRPHPHSQYSVNPAAVQSIRNRVRDSRVSYVSPNVTLRSLLALPNSFGITHHGTIAPELAAAGIRCLSSEMSPWSTNWCFSDVWSSPTEYLELLGEAANNPSLSARNQLLRKAEVGRYLQAQRISDGFEHTNLAIHDRLIRSTAKLAEDFGKRDIYPAIINELAKLSPSEHFALLSNPSSLMFCKQPRLP